MANASVGKSRITRDDPRVAAAFAGWHDALNGRPLNPYYADHAHEHVAGTYMNWRLRATAVKCGGVKVPMWRTTRQVPHQVMEAFRYINQRDKALGLPPVMPTIRVPDDPTLVFA